MRWTMGNVLGEGAAEKAVAGRRRLPSRELAPGQGRCSPTLPPDLTCNRIRPLSELPPGQTTPSDLRTDPKGPLFHLAMWSFHPNKDVLIESRLAVAAKYTPSCLHSSCSRSRPGSLQDPVDPQAHCNPPKAPLALVPSTQRPAGTPSAACFDL